MNQVQGTEKKAKKIQAVAEHEVEGLRERVEHVRDIVENVRDKAEVAFRDKPYLLPVAAGAVGLGIGVLLGSRITRFILFTAVGSIVSDMLGGEIKRIAGDFIGEFQNRLGEGELEADTDAAG
jgi:tetrahydromethanopterin S-methyltransferase subunit F